VSPVLTQVNDRFNPKGIIAFNPDDMDVITKRIQIEEKITEGHFPLRKNQIAVSTVIANEFNIGLGDKVLLHSPSKLARLIKKDESGRYAASDDAQYYLPSEFTVSAIFKFGKYDFDKNIMFACLDDADELFGIQWGDATHLYIWTDDPFHMNDFMNKYNQYLQKNKPGAVLQSWQEIHQQILGVLSVEKNMMFFLLIFIVLVAAFSITNTLITTVIQKTNEIGLLKSMGAASGSILRIFLLQGLFVGCIGTALGVILGVLVVCFRMNILEFMRQVSGQQIFPEEVYIFDKLPAHIVWGDVAAICVISVILCTAGALIPAFRAAKLDPAKALRYE